MRPRAPSFTWEDTRAFSLLETVVSVPPPAQSMEVGVKEEMVSRDTILLRSHFRNSGFSTLRAAGTGAFPAVSLMAGWAASRAMSTCADGRAFALEDPASHLEEEPREQVAYEAFECVCSIPTSRSI